jgi:hypothetical protein
MAEFLAQKNNAGVEIGEMGVALTIEELISLQCSCITYCFFFLENLCLQRIQIPDDFSSRLINVVNPKINLSWLVVWNIFYFSIYWE